ncbi:MAG TPA: inositol monophosphatase family protein [Pyrinomonadaceae bacterium]
MSEELSELLDLAKLAARLAAKVHRSALERGGFEVQAKGSTTDLVTEIDREAERKMVEAIQARRPNDSIVGEEGASIEGDSGVRWIIDPLDGTTNFIHGYPAHSVAVGVEIEGRRKLGVVQNTFSNRIYAGIVGGLATCDERAIAVRHERALANALVATGFLPDASVRLLQADLLREVLPRVRDIRRSGCPSLDICDVASGSLDAFYECGLGQWDIAGAAAIAEAAGAKVLLLHPRVLPDPLLIVANANLAGALVSLFEETGVVERASSTHTA